MPANPRLDGVAAWRGIYEGGTLFAHWENMNRRVALTTIDVERDLQSLTVASRERLSSVETRALWLLIALINGFYVQSLCEECYDQNGRLLCRWFRRGTARTPDEKLSPFRGLGDEVRSEQLARMHSAIVAMINAAFDIEKVVGNLIIPSAGRFDVEALHLLLCIHGAQAEWQKYWKARAADIADAEARLSRTMQKRLGLVADRRDFQRAIKPILRSVTELPADIPDTIKEVLSSAINSANRVDGRTRILGFLSEELEMELTPDVDERALGYRNELAHEGGFREDFIEATYDKISVVHKDVQRLRNIATEVVLRLCGYSGPVNDFLPPKGNRTIRQFATPFSRAVGSSA